MWKIVSITILLLILSVVVVQAQDDDCPLIVQEALTAVSDVCNPLDRNSACYGANTVESVTVVQPPPAGFFTLPGDRALLDDLREISPQPLDVTARSFGVAALNVQANVPETLPGQAVLFLLMGDARLTNEVAVDSEEQSAFQSFYFLPRAGRINCYEAEPMLTIQTPGNLAVNVKLNGVDTEMSPGTLLTITPSVCTIHRGSIIQRVGEETSVLVANQTVDIDIASNGQITVNNLRNISEREYQRGLDVQTAVNALALANSWDEQVITPAREFGVEPVSTPEAEAAVCKQQHTVVYGETLFRIAQRYNTSVQSIVDANGLQNRNVIYAGQVLCIPEGEAAPAADGRVACDLYSRPADLLTPETPGGVLECYLDSVP